MEGGGPPPVYMMLAGLMVPQVPGFPQLGAAVHWGCQILQLQSPKSSGWDRQGPEKKNRSVKAAKIS